MSMHIDVLSIIGTNVIYRPISPSADRELSRNSNRMTMNGYN